MLIDGFALLSIVFSVNSCHELTDEYALILSEHCIPVHFHLTYFRTMEMMKNCQAIFQGFDGIFKKDVGLCCYLVMSPELFSKNELH